ncbi:Hemolymph lipopolysaccharide-binding protein [Blattella germanica]|nr:Hemolymph lipopolysaccharide-binding protein [Blattella germanica]
MYLRAILLSCSLAHWVQIAPALECGPSPSNTLKFSIRNRQNLTGSWVAQIYVEEEGRNKDSNPLDVDIEHTTIKCQNTESVLIGATISVPPRRSLGYGYELVPGFGYYKFHTELESWHAAQVICIQEGAYLAIINSFVEVSIMKKLWDPHPKLTDDWRNPYAFIGASDLKKNKEFVTVFDQPVNDTGYSNWAPGNPKFTGHCVVVQRNGHLHDTDCQAKFPFFCEQSL